MLAKLMSFGLNGLNGYPINVEVDMHTGVPACDIVGLADTAVKEAKERVRLAIRKFGLRVSDWQDCGKPCAGRYQKRGLALRPCNGDRYACRIRAAVLFEIEK